MSVRMRNSGENMSQMQIAISKTTEKHYKNNSESSSPLAGYRQEVWIEHKEVGLDAGLNKSILRPLRQLIVKFTAEQFRHLHSAIRVLLRDKGIVLLAVSKGVTEIQVQT